MHLNACLTYISGTGTDRIDRQSYKQTYRTGSESASITDKTAGHPEVPQTTDELHHHDGFQVLPWEAGRNRCMKGNVVSFKGF